MLLEFKVLDRFSKEKLFQQKIFSLLGLRYLCSIILVVALGVIWELDTAVG